MEEVLCVERILSTSAAFTRSIVTAPEAIELVKDAMKHLQEVREQNTKSLYTGNLNQCTVTIGTDFRLKEDRVVYSSVYHNLPSNRVEDAEHFTNIVLVKWMLMCQDTINKIESGNTRNSQYFVDRPFNLSFIKSRVFSARICEQCNGIISVPFYTAHVGSLKCMKSALEIDLLAEDWVAVPDHALATTIMKSGITYDVRPTGLDVWVPQWVTSAIAQYKRNNGFGGLTLAEFLRKMSLDHD